MQVGSASANRILTWLTAIAFGALAGHSYIAISYDNIPQDVLKTMPGLRGGVIVAGCSAAFEIFVMRGPVGAWFRRRAFLSALFVRVLIHTVFVVCGLLLNRFVSGVLIGRFVSTAFVPAEIAQDTIYAFLAIMLLLFVLQMRTLIGGRTLLNVVLGRYHRPVREQRIFVLFDLTGSTPLAGKIGDERFHEFLSAFFFELYQRPFVLTRYGCSNRLSSESMRAKEIADALHCSASQRL